MQSNPTQGLKFFFVIGELLLFPIYVIKKSSFTGPKTHYRRNYVTSGSGIAGCDCSFSRRRNFLNGHSISLICGSFQSTPS